VKFRLLSVAELEAADAAIWYEDQRHGLGGEFLAALEESFDRIRDAPSALPLLEHLSGSAEIRRCLLHRFPYVVIFQCRPEELLVVAVSHVRRRPLHWLERLG
jgi:hypothetical protein